MDHQTGTTVTGCR